MDKYGKEVVLKRIGQKNKAMLESFLDFSKNMENEEITVEMFAEWLQEDDRNMELNRLGLTNIENQKVKRDIGLFLVLLSQRGALKPTVQHARRNKPQKWLILSNRIDYPDIPLKRKKAVKPAKSETSSEQVDSTAQVTSEQVEKPEQAEETVPTENKYSLDNVLKFSEMDLAFIGYTIRTEMDILQKQTGFFAHENQKLRDEVARLREETTTKPYAVKIQDLEYQIEVLKRNHASELRSKDIDIERLNQKLTALNQNLETAKQQIARSERLLDRAEANRRGFSVGELAFPEKKPDHLKGQ